MKPGEESMPEYVVFDTDVSSIRSVLIVFLIILALLAIFLWMHLRRKQERKRQIRLRISDLKGRTLGMKKIAALLSEDEQEQI